MLHSFHVKLVWRLSEFAFLCAYCGRRTFYFLITEEKNEKIVALILILLMSMSFFACTKSEDDLSDINNVTNNSINDNTISSKNDSPSTNNNKIKLLGNIIPRPTLDYDVINRSYESVYLTVENASEDDFRAYVNSCRSYGFDGEIKSATVLDLYYREYNDENYFLEVRFMEEEQEFSVFVQTPNKFI